MTEVFSAQDQDGQDLLDVANEAWNPDRGEYSGPYFRRSVAEAMKKDADAGDDSGGGHRKKRRKVRREEAAASVSHIFDEARNSTPRRLGAVSADAMNNNSGAGTDLHDFAQDVADSMENVNDSTVRSFDPISLLTIITSIIQTVVPLFQQCKKPKPDPTPTPTPTPST